MLVSTGSSNACSRVSTLMTLPSTTALGSSNAMDEMAAAVVSADGAILSSRVHGQADVHEPYGGVVPELASRDHLRAVSQVVSAALAEAKLDADALAVLAFSHQEIEILR